MYLVEDSYMDGLGTALRNCRYCNRNDFFDLLKDVFDAAEKLFDNAEKHNVEEADHE